jgi:hypothetical protein
MGHKGVSKRKPKKLVTPSGADNKSRAGVPASVQSLVNDKAAPLNRDGINPSAGSNNSQKKKR